MNSEPNGFQTFEKLVEELVEVARLLAEGSRHDISFNELKELQEKQNAILKEIELLQKEFNHNSSPEARERIKLKLHQFEEQNQIFIKNVKRQKGMIHLEGS